MTEQELFAPEMGNAPAKKMGFTHDNKNNITADWWTPPYIFEGLGEVFDLDVSAPEGGVPWLPAKRYFTIKDNGLLQRWEGFVWCNPPYGKETGEWLRRMDEHNNGVALVFARTDCQWFHRHCARADALLFLKGRIKFVDGLGKTKGSGAGCGSLLVGYGPRGAAAVGRMKEKGWLA